MPTHRSVTITLQSQYDCHTIPETLTSSSRKLLPIANRTITAAIPIYPASQFWISYQCPLPPPAKPGGDETKFYYFKLLISGKCVLSWGVGEDEEWQGKVVCGFWDAGTDFDGKRVVEKKGLFFPNSYERVEGSAFEIRVFRAKARKREEVRYEAFRDERNGEDGLEFKTTGGKKKGERQRFYTYALIDPIGAPYVAFRYLYMTKEQLHQLESQAQSDEETIDIFPSPNVNPALPDSPSPRSGLDLPTATSAIETKLTRRLSIPPRTALQPSTSPPKSPSPVKKERSDETATRVRFSSKATGKRRPGHPRTPSPAYRGRFDISPGTPPSQRKAASSGLLRGVIASALKRNQDKR